MDDAWPMTRSRSNDSAVRDTALVERGISHVATTTPRAVPEGGLLADLRVLLVEDHDDLLYIIQTMLESFGASVFAVASADDALRVLNVMRPDVLLSDINMPIHDGLWLIHEVRSQDGHGSLPAIALTARVGAEDRRLVLAAGFQAHVPKPIDFDRLVHVIRCVVAGTRSGAGS
jgi:CheY-like chemotaxis protein